MAQMPQKIESEIRNPVEVQEKLEVPKTLTESREGNRDGEKTNRQVEPVGELAELQDELLDVRLPADEAPAVGPVLGGERVERGIGEQKSEAINLPQIPNIATKSNLPQFGKNVVKFPNSATRGNTNFATEENKELTNSATRGRKPNDDGFTWDRVKPSKNTWAYRWRRSGIDSATGKRYAPVYVRYLSDAAAQVFERQDAKAIKKLVGGWYEQKAKDVGTSNRSWTDSVRAM